MPGKKPGRKPLAPLYVQLPPEMKKDLEKLAEKEYKTVTLVLREAIEAFLKSKAESRGKGV